MKTKSIRSRLIAIVTAGAIVFVVSAAASAEEPGQKITVAELKRIMKQREEEQKLLETTPEYQAKKLGEEVERKHREEEKQLTKENELWMKFQAAELERMKLENKRMTDPPATNNGSGDGTGGNVVPPIILDGPRLMVDPTKLPPDWFGKPSAKEPRMPGWKPTPAPRPATKIR
jgi:hypothetical protein